MTISIAPARNEYTANAAQTIFNYTFKIFENTDLNVYITPAGQEANDSTDLTTAYTVTGLGDEDGGTITLSVGTNTNDLVTIVSNVPSSRTIDYQNNGDFRPHVVNNDFDRVVSIAKKVEDIASRAVLLQQSQQDPKPLTLEKPIAGLAVRWNGGETGLENYDTSTLSNEEILADKVVINYKTLLVAINDSSLKLNQSCNIKERTTGNGGGAMWDAVLASSVTVNALDIVQCVGFPALALVLRTNGFYVASQLGATHDSADSAAILNYIMTKNDYVIDGTYSVASSLFVNTNTSGDMQNTEITALTDDFKVISATGKNKFEMTGNLKVKGPGMGVGTGVGIWFFDCYNYKMDCNADVSYLGESIIIDGTAIAPGGLGDYRGRQGRWTNPTAHNCKKGIQTLRRAEYSLWSNPQVSQCTDVGWVNTAGNTNVFGGNIQDNQNGVLLQETGTTNANHGMFTSVNINHNIGYNIRAEDTKYGHTFNGCHIYGDSASAGTIELIGSSGINITDGIIDAKIIIDGLVTAPTAEVTGWNRISGNQVDENFSVFQSTNNGREKTIVTDNFQRNGDAWGFNDRAFVEAKASAETSTQTLISNTTTTILFPTEKSDNRNSFDHTTGVFTTSQAVNIMVEFNFQVSISGGVFVDGFVAVYVNGTPQALSGLISFNAANTSLGSNGHLTLALQASDVVSIRANVESTGGVITVGADEATNVSFVSSN